MRKSFAVSLLLELATELELELVVEPTYGFAAQLTLPDGRRKYMRDTAFDLNGAGATEIAQDKDYAAFFLKQLGYPVPEGAAFFTRAWCNAIGSDRGPERAWEYAQDLGLPVFVKPNTKSQGIAVWLAHNRREFFRAVAASSRADRVYLVQRPAEGLDFRIVLLDGDLISAYQRLPLSVVGDGQASVLDLLRVKQADFDEAGRDTKIDASDPRIAATLRRLHLTPESVVPEGHEIALLPIANLSAGGSSRDVTDTVSRAWVELATTIARDMNLRYAGIDVLTPTSIVQPPERYAIIEVNAAPGLDNYAAMGQIQERRVKDLYTRVLTALTVD